MPPLFFFLPKMNEPAFDFGTDPNFGADLLATASVAAPAFFENSVYRGDYGPAQKLMENDIRDLFQTNERILLNSSQM